MHELSVAYHLVEIAEQAARDAGARQVTAVHLRLGAFSGIVEDALRFGYDVATEGTLLAGSKLIVEPVPLVVHCPTCRTDVELDSIQLFVCPVCGTPTVDIRQGKEIEIHSLEVEGEGDETTEENQVGS